MAATHLENIVAVHMSKPLECGLQVVDSLEKNTSKFLNQTYSVNNIQAHPSLTESQLLKSSETLFPPWKLVVSLTVTKGNSFF